MADFQADGVSEESRHVADRWSKASGEVRSIIALVKAIENLTFRSFEVFTIATIVYLMISLLIMNVGAWFTAPTLITKVATADESTPPLAVPPLSPRRTWTWTVPAKAAVVV